MPSNGSRQTWQKPWHFSLVRDRSYVMYLYYNQPFILDFFHE